MPATRKISREAQNQDLEQLKSLFGTKSTVSSTNPTPSKPIETVQPQESVQPSEKIQTVALSETQQTAEQKTTSDTTVGIRMTTQKKREIKAFFIQKGTTLSQGILDAYNLLKELDAEGIVTYKDGQLIRN